MRWIGLNEGYVSGDGRFLVAQVTVKGRRGDVQKWVLYGLVVIESDDPIHVKWGWDPHPLFGPADTKRACQDWATESDYEPTTARADDSAASPSTSTGQVTAWETCQECGVDYTRPPGHVYLDYCGPTCFTIVCERVEEVRENLRRRTA